MDIVETSFSIIPIGNSAFGLTQVTILALLFNFAKFGNTCHNLYGSHDDDDDDDDDDKDDARTLKVTFQSVSLRTKYKTKGIHKCGNHGLKQYPKIYRLFFTNNERVMRILADGEKEHYTTMVYKLKWTPECYEYRTLCKYFVYCIKCENDYSVKHSYFCKLRYG